MSKTNKIRSLYGSAAAISLIVGAVNIVGAHQVSAFATVDSSSRTQNNETCLYSLQLQKSVDLRRQYLVKLEEALGETTVGDNSIEEMYGNIKKASYSDSEAPGWVRSGSAGSQGGKGNLDGIDSFSVDCISCHDGVAASSVGFDIRNRPLDRRSFVASFTSDHPIGMDYNRYVEANRGYKPVLPGSNKMLFVKGKVGCLTCHDPLNAEKGHLVMSDRNSALCLTCHSK
jgi:predicted CXXCH cytochrome family protein